MSSLKALRFAFLLAAPFFFSAAANAQTACPPSGPNLIIYRAGSLTTTFAAVEKIFTAQTGVCVTDVTGGSLDAARRITAGGQTTDIFASADYEDIDLLLKPVGYADFDIHFAQGSMVLAYTTASRNAATIAQAGTFEPPYIIPPVATDWISQLTQTGVNIAASHPFLDPTGYRDDMVFQLAEKSSGIANLYDTFLQHYSITKSSDVIGKTYDYAILYESSAYSQLLADTTGTYRYAKLPDDVNLGNPGLERVYKSASVTVPGLDIDQNRTPVTIPATRVEWGLTIAKSAPNRENAIKFLKLLFSSQGLAAFQAAGLTAISPPLVHFKDFEALPHQLKSLVAIDPRRER